MKIRIVESKKEEVISEKKLIVSAFNSDYVINSLLDPNSPKSIFNKKTIFYDLETNGFLPDAYVHQIAALEYDLKPQMDKIFNGEKPDDVSDAKNGIVVKAKFELEDFKKKDKKIIKSRKEFYKEFYQRPKASVDKVSRMTVLSYVSKRTGGRWRVNFEIDHKTLPIIIGAHITRNSKERDDLSKLLKTYLSYLIIDNAAEKEGQKMPPLTETIKGYIKTCMPDGETLAYPTETGEEASNFFETLFKLISSLTSSPYSYGSKRGGKRYEKKQELEQTIKDLKRNEFAFTYAENKMFTEYEEFPLDKYKFLLQGNYPSEKEGLEMFLDYLNGIGNKNYILVGHNINAFDNRVIVARSQVNGIKSKELKNFQNSMTFDTLPLLRLYVKQMEHYSKLVKEKSDEISPEQQALEQVVDKKMNTLREIYPSLKAKLDGLMKLFEETKDYEQTHTADDDCDQLAKVFVGATLDMFEMMKAYNDLLSILDAESATPFIPKQMTWKDMEGPIVSKIMEDVVNYFYTQGKSSFLKKYPFLDASQDNPKVIAKNLKDARKTIYSDFTNYLLEKKRKEDKNFRPEFMLELDTEDSGKQFIKWMERNELGKPSIEAKDYIEKANKDYRLSALTRSLFAKNIENIESMANNSSMSMDAIYDLLFDTLSKEDSDDKLAAKFKEFIKQIKKTIVVPVATPVVKESLRESKKRFKIRILK